MPEVVTLTDPAELTRKLLADIRTELKANDQAPEVQKAKKEGQPLPDLGAEFKAQIKAMVADMCAAKKLEDEAKAKAEQDKIPKSDGTVSFNNTALTAIQAKVWAKQMVELTGIPDPDGTVLEALTIEFMALRNKQVESTVAGTQTIANSAGATIATADTTDTGSVFTKGKYA